MSIREMFRGKKNYKLGEISNNSPQVLSETGEVFLVSNIHHAIAVGLCTLEEESNTLTLTPKGEVIFKKFFGHHMIVERKTMTKKADWYKILECLADAEEVEWEPMTKKASKRKNVVEFDTNYKFDGNSVVKPQKAGNKKAHYVSVLDNNKVENDAAGRYVNVAKTSKNYRQQALAQQLATDDDLSCSCPRCQRSAPVQQPAANQPVASDRQTPTSISEDQKTFDIFNYFMDKVGISVASSTQSASPSPAGTQPADSTPESKGDKKVFFERDDFINKNTAKNSALPIPKIEEEDGGKNNMKAKEIKELRKEGRLEEALTLAKAELQAAPDNIWSKRKISWVYYDYLKQNSSPEQFEEFISWLAEIKMLDLPAEEKMLFEQLCWQVGKMAFGILKNNPKENSKGIRLFEIVQSFQFPKPSEGYSFLFKAFHKTLKETDSYLQFADWWDFKNFIPADYEKEQMPNGKEIMSLAEQAYIAYAKHLLPKKTVQGQTLFNKEKAEAFLPVLSELIENHPQYQYPAYFNAKLLLAIGDKENMLTSLLPFARKKRNDFWVWEILAEAFSSDQEMVFACYCKALSCTNPPEMLVNLRQKMAKVLIAKGLFNEAKTEIELLIQARNEQGYNIPPEVSSWEHAEWYKTAVASKSNYEFYRSFVPIADSLLFSDISEEMVIVEFVNSDKKILNFIASESKFGAFKYDRFFKDVKIGDTLKVRFQGGSMKGIYQIYTAVRFNDEAFRRQFVKDVQGTVKILPGKPYGFIDDVFIHPSQVKKQKLIDGMQCEAKAIKAYNREKEKWGWKLL